jgi:adhesin transport system outer membrane protein
MKNKNRKAILFSLTVLPFLSSSLMAETLQQVIQETLLTNPRVLASESEKLAREQQLQEAQGGYYPSVDITAAAGKEYSRNPATVSTYGDDDFYDLSRKESAITLRQNVFKGFETRSQVDQQQARVEAAGHLLANDRDEIALRTSQVYLDVIRQREILRLAQANLNKHQSIFNKVQQRSKSGVGRSSDLEQARGRLSLARSNLAAAQANLFDAEANYMRVVGKAVPEKMETPQTVQHALPADLEMALNSAHQTNPLLASASAEVKAATAVRDGSRSTYYPQFDLVLSRAWNENLDGIEAEDDEYYAMLQMRWNIFNGGSDSARKRASAHLLNRR